MTARDRVTNIAEPLTWNGGNGGRFEFAARRMGAGIGLQKLGCSVYVVPPGKTAFPYHSHKATEELFIILDGTGLLRHEDEEVPIKEGDVVAAPVGESHQITNTSDEDLRYVAVSNVVDTDVNIYPDSGKILAFSEAAGRPVYHLSREGEPLDYYDGEE